MRCRAGGLFAAFLLTATGCFPYRETYRPAMTGVVLRDGAAVPGAAVVSCSGSHWYRMPGCLRRAIARSDATGRFSFERLTAWEWRWLGDSEGPQPLTEIAACVEDGLAALGSPSENRPLNLALRHEESLVKSRDSDVVLRECRAQLEALGR
jgi:hypothetical protein